MNQGFTLVELLVVVLIVGVLSALALPQYTVAIERARATEALTLMSAAKEAVERYRFQHDKWPDEFSDLDVNIPVISGTSERGGKNFTLQIGSSNNNVNGIGWVVAAVRRDLTPDQGGYILQIYLEDNDASETITSRRSCTGKSNSVFEPADLTAKAKTFCDAITGGNNNNF